MLTSSTLCDSLHFTKFRPKIRPFFAFSPFFSRFSYALVPIFSPKCQSMWGKELQKMSKNQKSRFFFTNIFFLKVKMDMVFMSFFKKKDRIFTNFFPASFHLTGLKTLASKILLSQKKSEISICPNRGYGSASCACAHAIVSWNAGWLSSYNERGCPGSMDFMTASGPGVKVHDILNSCLFLVRFHSRNSATLSSLYAIMSFKMSLSA